ncbi:putative hemin transport protein [Roseivirga pacifica]|uniref:Putative hemin transport protein n=1 Tax=Roseivirga pacifica TaxID=1267423 RepID=A0A1I0RND8_9BACT|nr:ChuX/HutX family heme-like substrate-binding protein [Roseivirga pacifica]RKQ49930.1 putative hemin transport protein [Roseivirga pacifica]SEW42755.1 putative hemin transport protein [Roseivirga pacifica]
MPDTMQATAGSLLEAYQNFKEENPKVRIRDAAKQLGVSEAELLATGIGNDTVRLQGPWDDLLKRFKSLGHVMSLTRNDACVLEHKGTFEKIGTFGAGNHHMATVIGPIESRVFFKNWGHAFAHTLDKGDRVMHSIQVFDAAGDAITKVYLQADGDFDAYEQLIEDFKAEDQSTEVTVTPYEPISYATDVNKEELLKAWAEMEDTHDFFPMLRKFNAERLNALELAEGKFTRKLSVNVVPSILSEASETQLPIMIFAGNHGNLQIHQDVVNKIVPLDRGEQQWINVMDPNFNLHLRTDMIASAWAVEKPTKDGIVTSVEVFGEDREIIAQFFGLRKPGQTELTEWKALVANLK